MTPHAPLTDELKRLVLDVEDDLRTQLNTNTAAQAQWRDEHRHALSSERTAAAWESFRDDHVTQVAVSWVLTTVFIRFCEDNSLVTPVWISGPSGRRQEALDAELAFFREHPEQTHREWLGQAVRYLRQLPSTSGLVDDSAPMNRLRVSGQMAERIVAFWRETDDEGMLLRDFTDPKLSTRFLGDLYQDLSEHAKKTYALLQTPEFVEEFILDQTLTPALAERPLEGFRLIDPTCGSGHFLLGAFQRFLDRWREEAPELDVEQRVLRSLGSVFGVDKNPFAVAVAKFRLTVAALQALGETSLEDTPELALNLAAGDSLLPWDEWLNLVEADDEDEHLFTMELENREQLGRILQPGSYDAVVGNPPYITVKDKKENAAYREQYLTCKGTYSLSVPFMERFFELAKSSTGPAGWVGQITSNSFMKREFGSRLIEWFLAHKDLQLVVDSSGAYIPGHGTPTVILVGRNLEPSRDSFRALLGVRGEPGRPARPAEGRVWREVVAGADQDLDGDFITSKPVSREAFDKHPWSLQGGSAPEILSALETGDGPRLGDLVDAIGRTTHTGQDDAFFVQQAAVPALGLVGDTAPVVLGEFVRDFTITGDLVTILPYDAQGQPRELSDAAMRTLWRSRQTLRRQLDYGQTKEERGLRWFDHSMFFAERFTSPLSIAFAFVATHNHFVLDRGGKVFNRSAPVIKLPKDATEEGHFELLGVLNSSTACFWLKQNSHNKGSTVDTKGARQTQVPWEDFYEFTGTTLKDFLLPTGRATARPTELDSLAQAQQARLNALSEDTPTPAALAATGAALTDLQEQSVAAQEELDWEVYGRYGLLNEPPVCAGAPRIKLGERAFEIVLARRIAAGDEDREWFERHHSEPVTEIPQHWPEEYRKVVQRRIELIESDRFIGLLEQPEYKRRWATEPWEKTQERILREWLLDRLEDRHFWFDRQDRPRHRSIANLSDELMRDREFMSVLQLWDGRPDAVPSEALARLLLPESVPYLAAQRLKESGMRKFAAWQRTWDLQRREDAGEQVEIPVPPKYTTADFRRADWWRARGKLDVPKERFILYPGANRANDASELIGWAGWNHLQQALALLSILTDRANEGAPTEQQVPLVAGLVEILPWVRQWHAGIDENFGQDMAQFLSEQTRDAVAAVGMTEQQLADWRPPAATRGRRSTRR